MSTATTTDLSQFAVSELPTKHSGRPSPWDARLTAMGADLLNQFVNVTQAFSLKPGQGAAVSIRKAAERLGVPVQCSTRNIDGDVNLFVRVLDEATAAQIKADAKPRKARTPKAPAAPAAKGSKAAKAEAPAA